jgi:diguanylate cyclase
MPDVPANGGGMGETQDVRMRPVEVDALRQELERLLAMPAGSVVYDQLAHIVAEWASLEKQFSITYRNLLRLLIDEFAREPTSERVLALAGRLIQTRHDSAPLSVPEVSLDEFAMRVSRDADLAAGVVQLVKSLAGPAPSDAEPRLAPLPPLPAVDAPGIRSAVAPAPIVSTSIPDDSVELPPQNAGTELRVNNVYRQHLERKRDEIDRLQEMLSNKVQEAIAQNKEFGDLLQIEHGALQQADTVEEVAALRQILIGGIEELLKGQRTLAGNLTGTSEYLQVLESDSERLRAELQKVRLLSLTDDFTGLPNRRAFMRRLEDEIGRAQRYETPLALAILDLDGFKQINDTFGHAGGDRVLRCYADHILSTFRHHDMVARYGGEEFAVLLPNTALEGAASALRKVQSRIAQAVCDYEGHSLPLPTFSAGLTLYHHSESLTSLIDRADRTLYRAKRFGRNRIEMEPWLREAEADGDRGTITRT